MNKPLTLGVVAALLMAGGQQVAAQISACPSQETVGAIEATPGFSCTITDSFGTATFSHFSFSPLITAADASVFALLFEANPDGVISRPPLGNAGFTVDMGTPEYVDFPAGSVPNIMDYQISISNVSSSVTQPGLTFALLDNSAFAHTAPATGGVTAVMSLAGNVVGSLATSDTADVATGGNASAVLALDGDTTLTVYNSIFTATGNIRGGALSNSFGGTLVPVVPEPMSLSLFGVGVAGLGFAMRRKAG